MKTGIDTNFSPHDLERSVNDKFKVNFQTQMHRMARKSPESFWRSKYANSALDLDPITQVHA